MGKQDNLRPAWSKGESGNPNGRPKGSLNKSTLFRYWLEALKDTKNPITGEIEKLEIRDQMVIALISKALKGDVQAFKELMDGAYGVNKQVIEQDIKQINLLPEDLRKKLTDENNDSN